MSKKRSNKKNKNNSTTEIDRRAYENHRKNRLKEHHKGGTEQASIDTNLSSNEGDNGYPASFTHLFRNRRTHCSVSTSCDIVMPFLCMTCTNSIVYILMLRKLKKSTSTSYTTMHTKLQTR
jgi:hypothetical protein